MHGLIHKHLLWLLLASLYFVNLSHADFYIYRDNLENGFGNWSWTEDDPIFNNSSHVYEGATSIRVHYTGEWEGLFLGHVPGVSTRGYDSLVFAVSALSNRVHASHIVVKLKDENQNDLTRVSLFSYVPYSQSLRGAFLNPLEHRLVVVPLQWLNAVNRTIGGIMILSERGNTTINIDYMKLAHVGLGVPGTLLSDGLGLTVINESWASIIGSAASIIGSATFGHPRQLPHASIGIKIR